MFIGWGFFLNLGVAGARYLRKYDFLARLFAETAAHTGRC